VANCIKPVGNQGGSLDPDHFNYDTLKEGGNLNSDRVFFDKENQEWVFEMGQLTDHRAFWFFFKDHLQPHVKVAGLRLDLDILDEDDNFQEPYVYTVKFGPPGHIPQGGYLAGKTYGDLRL